MEEVTSEEVNNQAGSCADFFFLAYGLAKTKAANSMRRNMDKVFISLIDGNTMRMFRGNGGRYTEEVMPFTSFVINHFVCCLQLNPLHNFQ